MAERSLDEAFSVIAERLSPGATLVRHWPLSGGVSAQVHALEFSTAAAEHRRVVVRRHGAAAWKPLADNVATAEFQLLCALHRAQFPVPVPLRLDVSNEVLPSPYVVLSMIDGSTALAEGAVARALPQMATCLARLHALDVRTLDLPALQEREDPVQGALDYLPADPQWSSLRAAVRAYTPRSDARSLLHGDYWPGNILWSGSDLAAIIDWEDAAIGSLASDLACCRAELNAAWGEAAMQTFTRHYIVDSGCDLRDLALWEVYVAAAALASMHAWLLPAEVEAQRRQRTAEFLARAASELLAQLG